MKLMVCADLQVSVTYTEPSAALYGLSPEEAVVTARWQFTVVAGPRHHLILDVPPAQQCRCFNAGTPQQRTVISATQLKIVDS